MTIKTLQVGPIMTNCYLLCDEDAKVCALIDPGDDAARVEQLVRQSGCALKYILLTHGHFDHTSAVRPLLERYPDVPVYIHEKDSVTGRGGELLFTRVDEQHQRYYKEGDVLPPGRAVPAGHGNTGPLRGLRVSAVGPGARDLCRGYPVPLLLRTMRLPRRQLSQDARLPGPSGGTRERLAGPARP